MVYLPAMADSYDDDNYCYCYYKTAQLWIIRSVTVRIPEKHPSGRRISRQEKSEWQVVLSSPLPTGRSLGALAMVRKRNMSKVHRLILSPETID